MVSLGNGDGTFGAAASISVGNPATALVAADFNQDGHVDLAVAAGSAAVVLLGNGNGTFQAPLTLPITSTANSIATGVFTGNGTADLAVLSTCISSTNCSFGMVSILLGNGNGTFQNPTVVNVGYQPPAISVNDLNGDGKADISTLNAGGNDVSILVGNGDGTFQPPANFGTDAIVGKYTTADFSSDGAFDIAVATGPGVSFLFNRVPGASAVLSTDTLAFGSQVVNLPLAAPPVTLSNLGRSALAISSIKVTGPQNGDFSETDTCGTSLPAGDDCLINISFTPLGAGTRSATLAITDSATSSPQTIALSGTGLAGTLNFQVATGSSNSETVAAGKNVVYLLSIGGGGVAGSATLACTGAPAGATCSVPATTNVSASQPSIVTVNVTTTSRTTTALAHGSGVSWMWAMGIVELCILPGSAGSQRARRSAAALLRSWPLLLLVFLASCGGGSSSNSSSTTGPQTNPNGTPAGTYTLTVTATVGSIQQTVPLTLSVE